MAPGCRYALGDVLEWTNGKWTEYVVRILIHLLQTVLHKKLYGDKIHSLIVY